MNFIIICGPPASGKMTVGQSLQKTTGYKLFHNHLSLELVNQFFDWSTPDFNQLDKKIRFDIFEAVAKSDLKGLVFTMVCAFDDKRDLNYIDEIIEVFKDRKPKVCFVELTCALDERLERNKTENRLKHKPSKRNIEFSEQLLLKQNEKYRMNTLEGEFSERDIFKVENTHLSADEVATKIVEHFDLK